jgi:hypothetical protein
MQPLPSRVSSLKTTAGATLDALPDIKPLRGLRNDHLRPLPSIKGSSGGDMEESSNNRLAQELSEKKRATEEAIRRSKEQLAGQRRNEEDLRRELNGIDPEEVERRSRHMREQRELLLAKKKMERENKVAVEEERRRKQEDGEPKREVDKSLLFGADTGDSKGSGGSSGNTVDVAEMRRSTMRMALARRLKTDLSNSEEAKIAQLQETQFAELDQKLQLVEQLREDSRKKEYLLNKQLERQKEQIARNVELSAAALARQRDDLS